MRISFIGGGNMASALINGLLQQGYAPEQLRVVEIDPGNRDKIKATYGILATVELKEGIADSDVILFAVKPQQLFDVAKDVAPLLTNQLIISIAAGIRAADIVRWIGGYQRVIRAMPNTPSLVRAGVAGLYAAPFVEAEEKHMAESILSAVGATLWVDEEEMLHAVTAISGSGPAYVFYFMEAIQQAAMELGLAPAQARQLSIDTFMGASKLASASEEDVAMLRMRVTSKGGTTERAILSMEINDIRCKIVSAIHAANERSRELSDELGSR